MDGTVFIATGVFFLFWFHRAYRNLPALGGDRRYGTGWAIGSWFVPFLNAWRPKQIVNDIWRESGARTTDEYGTKDEGKNVPNLFSSGGSHGSSWARSTGSRRGRVGAR